ncbi:hypothetical protein IT407_04850 [Candidatus Uhrbacteria bacterium]|nr:hypothetical protein [Candidatus Uhrbacteria bacterium]
MSAHDRETLSDLILEAKLNTSPAGIVGMAVTGRVHHEGFGCLIESCHTEKGRLILGLSIKKLNGRRVEYLDFEPKTKVWLLHFQKPPSMTVSELQFFHRSC